MENSLLTCSTSANVSPPLFPSSNAEDQSVGARLKLFLKEWRSVTNDPWILQIVDSGFRIDFISRPFQSADPGECSMSQQMQAVCDEEVSNLLRKKAISLASNTPGFFSRIFAIPKISGGYRPIINLKNLNQHIHYSHFKM
jgi:hypothetical protein